MANEGWAGLDEKNHQELSKLIFEITPPLHRKERFNALTPSRSASKLISYIIEHVIEGEILSVQPHREGSKTISQQLQDVLKCRETYVSEIKRGELSTSDGNSATWAKLRLAFRWLLKGSSTDVNDSRAPWVERLSEYFFAHEPKKPPPFFSRAVLGKASPQRLEEGIYNTLWTADRVLHHNMNSCIVAVSGALPFGYIVSDSVLTEIGKALVLSAAAGVRVVFAYLVPESGQPSGAQKVVETFWEAAKQFIGTDEWPFESKCVFDKVANRDELRSKALDNIFIRGIERENPNLVPGFFTPTSRFGSFRTYDQTRALHSRAFFLIRPPQLEPPMFEFSDVEEELFFHWCLRVGLPVDPMVRLPLPLQVTPPSSAVRSRRRK